MTFSICVRERYENSDGVDHIRFGTGITTRVANIGMKSPYVTENAAVCAQAGGIDSSFSIPNIELRKKVAEYVEDGVSIEDAIPALLKVDDQKSIRQTHGVDAEGSFAHTGDEASDWAGHVVGDGFTVAGNVLAGAEVVQSVAEEYREKNSEDPLPKRLIDALEAGYDAGGDKRTDLPVHSVAIRIRSSERIAPVPFDHDFRVDATKQPFDDIREVYDLAMDSYKDIGMGHYTDR
ncbi:DUF1028 domain-containing protein [Halorubrum trueperi]|uniref:DUF1028 domain-containing protein n=1 Tax=Halorubrum trueperi TaxID=2004704 RepID=A0ABD5UHF4_9EURY